MKLLILSKTSAAAHPHRIRGRNGVMHIQKTDHTQFIVDTLQSMQQAMPNVSHGCPHCGLQIRYPLIVRDSDIEIFNKLMKSAYRVMDRHGITANLLADIFAECHIAIAMKKSKEQTNGK
jgi:hypothetical protein